MIVKEKGRKKRKKGVKLKRDAKNEPVWLSFVNIVKGLNVVLNGTVVVDSD